MTRARDSDDSIHWSEHPRLTLLVADPDPKNDAAFSYLQARDPIDLSFCRDGAEALYQAGQVHPDLVVLSTELPRIPASDVVTVIRAHHDIPIALAVRAGEADSAGPGLAAGATCLLTRPYQRQDLDTALGTHLARAKARLQHVSVIRVGPLGLDSLAFQVTLQGTPIDLTLREFQLLRFLMLNADRVVTPDQIRKDVWKDDGTTVSTNTIAVHVGRLRHHLTGAAEIVRVRGVGYRLHLPEDLPPGEDTR